MQAASLPRMLPGSSIRCIFGYRQQQSRDEPGYCYDNSLLQIRIIISKMVREIFSSELAYLYCTRLHMEKCSNEFSPRRSSCKMNFSSRKPTIKISQTDRAPGHGANVLLKAFSYLGCLHYFSLLNISQ